MSQAEANKVTRILTQEKPLKFTVRLFSGSHCVLEFQTDNPVSIQFNGEDRAMWLYQYNSAYTNTPICRFPEDGVILTEENSKP